MASAALFHKSVKLLGGVQTIPNYRGRYSLSNGVPLVKSRFATDPIGTTTVTFYGIVAGTEIHVYLPDGTEIAGVESCVANQQLTWPVYAAGSPNNIVYITLIKRGLRWMKFDYQSVIGNQTLPIFQNPDLGYNNPA